MRKLIFAKVNPLKAGLVEPRTIFLQTQNLIKISINLSRIW